MESMVSPLERARGAHLSITLGTLKYPPLVAALLADGVRVREWRPNVIHAEGRGFFLLRRELLGHRL